MEELNILPIYRQGLNEITDGIELKAPVYCKKHCSNKNERCINYYKNICERGQGLYECPFGFNSYAFNIGEDLIIFTSLRIVGEYEKNKVMPKYLENEKKASREIDKKNVEKYAEAYINYQNGIEKFEEQNKFVEEIFHDIRKFNLQIMTKNERTLLKAENIKRSGDIIENSKGIQVNCWFLSLRLNSYYFSYSKQLLQNGIKSDYNMYNLFYKIKKCMKEKIDEKFLHCNLDANTKMCQNMQAYDCIEVLPFILLDNAIKYAPQQSIISINIKDKKNEQQVILESLGPYIPSNELDKIFIRGYRGENAKKATQDGLGIGLFTAKQICQLHNIKIDVNSSDIISKEIKNIKYSTFRIDLCIKIE